MLQIIPDTAQLKSKVVVVQFDLLKCEHIGEIHYLAIEASRQCAIRMCNTTQILLREYFTNTAQRILHKYCTLCTEDVVPGIWGVNQSYWSLCIKHWGVTKPRKWVYKICLLVSYGGCMLY